MKYFLSLISAIILSSTIAGGENDRILLRPNDFSDINYLENVRPYLEGKMCETGAQEWGCETDGGYNCVNWVAALEQDEPRPILISLESLFEGPGVTYLCDDYGLWAELFYADGSTETISSRFKETSRPDKKEWETLQSQISPNKPIQKVKLTGMFRWRNGKVLFRNPVVKQVENTGANYFTFDGLPVKCDSGASLEGDFATITPRIFLRDIVSDSDWIQMKSRNGRKYSASLCGKPVDIKLSLCSKTIRQGATHNSIHVELKEKEERCLSLVVAIPAPRAMNTSFDGLDLESEIQPNSEISHAIDCKAGMGHLNKLPIQGVGSEYEDIWIGLDPSTPAVFRTFFNSTTQELCIAFDLGFVPQNRKWDINFVRYSCSPGGGMRRAWQEYMTLFPEAFEVKTPLFGLWMPYSNISNIAGFEDFGFAFKEGDNETDWDDKHGMLSFHYTEPATWWMELSAPEGAKYHMTEKHIVDSYGCQEAIRKARRGDALALAWEKSVMYGPDQKPFGHYRETPWCNGIVWSMSDLPGISQKYGEKYSSIGKKWTAEHVFKNYPAANCQGTSVPCSGLDGEYIDSAEGYVSTELDFSKDHLSLAKVPLTFSLVDKQVAIFTGLAIFEYVREIATTVHSAGKLTMANSTPDKLFWLTPMIDVPGTETNWHWGGQWRPMSTDEMQYRRMMCGGKPYCFLQNTDFSIFSPEMIEKYMMKSLAFGFLPSFFSGDAFTGRYFENPGLYERDRHLFKKYIPICKTLAKAGWQCATGVSLTNKRLLVERFGNGSTYYITVFNPTEEKAEIQIESFAQGLQGDFETILGSLIIEPENTTVIKIDKH